MKLLTVVGARPQFIKAAAVGYAIQTVHTTGLIVQSILVHTGQRYDFAKSGWSRNVRLRRGEENIVEVRGA